MVSDRPLFSVVIATFNTGELLERTLASVLGQHESDWEAVVVDDGSTDGTAERVEQWSARFSGQLTLIRRRNGGCGEARNAGASAARGKYLAFLDHDDLWLPWSLAVYRQAVEAQPDAVAVVGSTMFFRKDNDVSRQEETAPRFLRFGSFLDAAGSGDWFGTSATVVRAGDFQAVGGFAVNELEDLDLHLRLVGRGAFVKIDTPVTLGHREHQSNLSASCAYLHRGLRGLRDAERGGRYPGGAKEGHRRRRIIATHAGVIAHHMLPRGNLRDAWAVYGRFVPWTVRTGVWRPVWRLPLSAVRHWLHPPMGN